MSQNMYSAISGLRTVRRYTGEPLSPEHLEAVLDAGRWTGSSKNRQGWAMVVFEGREELEGIASAGTFAVWVPDAAAAIALVKTPHGNDFDIGRLAQNLMLAADALGIGSCPITLHDQDRANEVIGLPDDHEARWAVVLGYADEREESEHRRQRSSTGMRGRVLLADIVHRRRFSR
ncbi:nitroreductase family protein [bacterium]|nr:nitroreductase family protein [bacterium]